MTEDVIIKGFGCYLLAVLESLFVFGAYLIGHFINHIPPELAVMIASILGSSQVLVVFLIRYFFKIDE